jgi:hypothetical protein
MTSRPPTSSWQFQTVQTSIPCGIRYEWRWRATEDGSTRVSERTFLSFDACIEDARVNGFRGSIDAGNGLRVTNRSDGGLRAESSRNDTDGILES